MLRADNPLVERTAYLLSDSQQTLAMQVERIMREANNPVRRTFRRTDELLPWLNEVLTPAEAARAQAFLPSV
jgi:hypothetical protein